MAEKCVKKHRRILFPTDMEFALVALVCYVIASISAWCWGTRAPMICLFCMIFLPMALIGTLISLGSMVFNFVQKWSKMGRAERNTRFVLAVILLAVTWFFVLAEGFTRIENMGIRHNVARTGGIERLQSWAVDILGRPQKDILVDPNRTDIRWLKRELYSEQVKRIQPSWVWLYSEPDKKYMAIQISGGGFTDGIGSAIVLSSPSTSIETEHGRLIKWRDGVYAFFGRLPP